MRQFDQGQTVRITVEFFDFDGALIDPDAVTYFTQTDADSVWVEYLAEVVHDETGIYHLDVDTSLQSGVWNWRVIGTGVTPNAKQGKFYVIPMNPDDTEPV